MGKFLALITIAAMALFIASPAMAQEGVVDKNYTFTKDSTITSNTIINVDKEVDIEIDGGKNGDLPATGSFVVQGDVIFKELDVQVQDEEVVAKGFELDDLAASFWHAEGSGNMNVAEQLQNGEGNTAEIFQNLLLVPNQMSVGLQYQVGNLNSATAHQEAATIPGDDETTALTNNFCKQIQIGDGNFAVGAQNTFAFLE